jgi:hypothetical protein
MSDRIHEPVQAGMAANGRDYILSNDGLGRYIAIAYDAGQPNINDLDRARDCWNAMLGVPDPAAYVKAFEEMRRVLTVLADNRISAENCATSELAGRRVRKMASPALELAEAAHPVLDAQLRASVAMLGEKAKP